MKKSYLITYSALDKVFEGLHIGGSWVGERVQNRPTRVNSNSQKKVGRAHPSCWIWAVMNLHFRIPKHTLLVLVSCTLQNVLSIVWETMFWCTMANILELTCWYRSEKFLMIYNYWKMQFLLEGSLKWFISLPYCIPENVVFQIGKESENKVFLKYESTIGIDICPGDRCCHQEPWYWGHHCFSIRI